MKEQFVTYEIAKQLKEKGFDEPCFGDYFHFERHNQSILDYDEDRQKIITDNTDENITKYLAPLWQQVIDWLSDVHNIEVDALRYTYRGGVYQGKCYMWFVDQYDPKYNHELEEDDSHWILNARKAQGYDFKTKREAILAGITEALTLI
jgi:hypothetical protein